MYSINFSKTGGPEVLKYEKLSLSEPKDNEVLMLKIDVLDKGFVEVVDSLGSDLTVVNSVRVSFGKRKKKWDKSDEKLVNYLAKHKHYSPFRHLQIQFHIKAPEFVMRQWYKHIVGIETTSNSSTKDHAWNEISGRYVQYQDWGDHNPVSISFAPTKLFASTRFGNLANSNFVRYPKAFDTSSVGGVDALALIVSNETLSTL